MTNEANGGSSGVFYDTIVVGSGAGGMTAALAAARKGHSVLLLEAEAAIGGMMNPFQRKRFHFDVGLHYVGECGPKGAFRRLFDSLGLEAIQFVEFAPEGFDRYVFPGFEGILCKGFDRWRDWLRESFPREKVAIGRFLDLMKAVESLTRMAMRGPRLSDLAGVVRHPGDIARLQSETFGHLLDRTFQDRRLKNVFAGPGGDLGLPPGRVSAYSSILLLTHYLTGAFYPHGGTHAYHAAYIEALRKAGVDMRKREPVAEIRVEGRKRFAVRTEAGAEYLGRTVVSNADAARTFEWLRGASPGWLARRKAASGRPSLGTICVFLGVDLDLAKAGLTPANIWHYSTDDIDGIYSEVLAGRLPEDPCYFLTSPTLKDPGGGHAPPGHHTLEIISIASGKPFERWFGMRPYKRGKEYEALKVSLADRLIESVERHYLPGLDKHIVLKEVGTPATVASYVRAPMGGIYGLEHTPDQTFLRRFLPTTGVPGLFLAGSAVLGAGVMPCTMSGAIAASLVHQALTAKRAFLALPKLDLAPSSTA